MLPSPTFAANKSLSLIIHEEMLWIMGSSQIENRSTNHVTVDIFYHSV